MKCRWVAGGGSGEDGLLPSVEEAYGLATCIPNCTVKVLPFSGHTALLEVRGRTVIAVIAIWTYFLHVHFFQILI